MNRQQSGGNEAIARFHMLFNNVVGRKAWNEQKSKQVKWLI